MKLTVAEKSKIVLDLVGAVSDEVNTLLAQHMEQIICEGAAMGCSYPFDLLYSQLAAIDLALAWMARKVDTKRGYGESLRKQLSQARGSSVTVAHSESQGWTCDWADSSSYNTYQNNSDSYSRFTETRDGQTWRYSRTVSWDRGRSDGWRNAFDRRQGQDVDFRQSEGDSTDVERSVMHSVEGAGSQIQNPYHEIREPIQTPILGSVQQWLRDRANEVRSDPVFSFLANIFDGLANLLGDQNLDVNDLSRGCGITPITGCYSLNEIDREYLCHFPVLRDGYPLTFDPGPDYFATVLYNPNLYRNYSAYTDASYTITIPLIIAALSFTVQSSSGSESVPRSGRNYQFNWESGDAYSRTERSANSIDESVSEDRARSDYQKDAHSRGESRGYSLQTAFSQSRSYAVNFSESRSGSDSASHSEGQSSSYGDSQSQSKSDMVALTRQMRDHEFDIRKWSQAFDALQQLRKQIVSQIEEAYASLASNLFKRGKVRKNERCIPDPRGWMGDVVRRDMASCCATVRLT